MEETCDTVPNFSRDAVNFFLSPFREWKSCPVKRSLREDDRSGDTTWPFRVENCHQMALRFHSWWFHVETCVLKRFRIWDLGSRLFPTVATLTSSIHGRPAVSSSTLACRRRRPTSESGKRWSGPSKSGRRCSRRGGSEKTTLVPVPPGKF